MIALTACFLFALGVSTTTATSLQGVDPNTLSCDPEGLIFLLLPHFTDCQKFYICAHGNEVEFTCPAELIFDFELQTCNYPRAVQCTLRTPDEEIEGSGYEPDVEQIIPDNAKDAQLGELAGLNSDAIIGDVMPRDMEKVILPQFSNILNCNNVDSAARQVAYKGDCQRFWKCVEGVPQALFCSDGLFFNEKSQQCDFEANSGCVVNQVDELQGEFIVYK